MEDKSRIEIIEEGVLQCSEPNFCVFCNPIKSVVVKSKSVVASILLSEMTGAAVDLLCCPAEVRVIAK